MIQLSLAELELADERPALAKDAALQALETFLEVDMPSYEGFCLLALADAAMADESYVDAEERACEALECFDQDGFHASQGLGRGLGRALLTLAEAQAAQHSPSAHRAFEKALEVFKFCQDEVWQAAPSFQADVDVH